MRIFIILGAILLSTALNAQVAFDGQKEMQEDMQVLVNELKLEKDQIFTLGNILEERRKTKESVAQQIGAVNQRAAMIPEDAKQDQAQISTLLKEMNAKMADADQKAFAQIEAILTPSQKATFNKEVKAKIATETAAKQATR